MLVLSRKNRQSIVIGDDIIVKVVEIKGDSVRLAIDAPTDISIYRGEIHQAIMEANKEAAVISKNAGVLPKVKDVKPQDQ